MLPTITSKARSHSDKHDQETIAASDPQQQLHAQLFWLLYRDQDRNFRVYKRIMIPHHDEFSFSQWYLARRNYKKSLSTRYLVRAVLNGTFRQILQAPKEEVTAMLDDSHSIVVS